jgi:5-methylcytosine-specific restriction endonuclease McrA
VARDRPRHRLYARVADRANHRCEYCLAPEEFSSKEFHVEHVAPRARGGADVLENLALACFRCNLSKAAAQTVPAAEWGGLIRLFSTRTDDWNAHFQFSFAASEELAFIQGTDDIGRATVSACG